MAKNSHADRNDAPLVAKEDQQQVKMDEILKLLFQVSNKVLVAMLGSLFGENFDPEHTDILISNNEFITEELSILRGDLFLTAEGNEKQSHYHIEFQTLNNAGMVIRMFEYGFKKARELAKYSSDKTIMVIPRQLVIFIEQNSNIQDKLKLEIIFPNGVEVNYTVPVMKYWEHNHQDLLERKLYPLLPLQVFKLRYKLEQLRKKRNIDKQQLIVAVLEAKQVAEVVAKEAKSLYDRNEIDGDDLHIILIAVESIFVYLNDKYTKVESLNEEVYKMVKTLYDPETERKGIEKGIEKVARQMLAEGEDIEKIMRYTGLSREYIDKLK